jgi:CHAT domain-containing protein
MSKEMIDMHCILRRVALALLFAALCGQAYGQFDLPQAEIRLENDTYAAAVQFLRNGDRESVMNLINRDPLAARFALIRLLRDPGASEMAHTFAQLFPMSSRSEIEMPFVIAYDKTPAPERDRFLDWMGIASRAEYIVTRQTQGKFWRQAAAQAVQNLDEAGNFFKTIGFTVGQAFCIRTRADNDVFVFDTLSFDSAVHLYGEARSIYESGQNFRGEVLVAMGLAKLYRRAGQTSRLRESWNAGLKLAQDAGDTISGIYLLKEFPGQLSTADKKSAWDAIERLPGLASLKHAILFTLAGRQHNAESKKYFDILENMVARETDSITAARINADFADEIEHDPSWDYSPEKALPYLDRAIDIARKLPYDPEGNVAGLLSERGRTEMGLLQYSRAESTFLEALDTLMRSTDKADLGPFLDRKSFLLLELAWLYQTTGDYLRAVEKAGEAQAIAEEIGFDNYVVQCIGVLASVHAELGDLPLAEQELLKASRVKTMVPTTALTTLAAIHLDFGFYSRALNDLEELDKDLKARPGGAASSVSETERLKMLALTWLRIGDLSKAMEYAKAAEARPSIQSVNIEEGLVGMVLMEMNRYPDAEKYFNERFAPTASGPRGPGAEADAHKNLGRLYRIENRRTEAIEQLTKALDIYRMMYRRKDELELLIELGQVALGGKTPDDGRPYLEQALKMAEEGQWPRGMWSVRSALADLAKADKDTGQAIEHLKAAVDAVETVSARLGSELTRSTFVENKIGLYDELIRLMGRSRADESFEYAERRRAQAFIESARLHGGHLASPADSELIRKKSEVEARLVGKQNTLWELFEKPLPARNQERIAATNRELDAIRSEHTELLRRIQEADPLDASRHGIVTAVMRAEVQHDILKPGDALVEYLVTSREIFAFVITPDQSRVVLLPATKNAIEKRIQRLLAPFSQLRSGQVDLLHMTYDVPLAHQLYQDLIAPLEPYIRRSRRLIVIPDDVLNYLPFESLARTPTVAAAQLNVRYAEYRDVDWLVNHYTIVYAVSATSLHPRFHQSNPISESLLAFGNPKLSDSQLKSAMATLRGAGTDASIPSLGALPQSGREVTTVARLLGPKVRATVLTGDRARKAEFINQSPSAGYIHFAVHSVVNEEQPYYSSLVLSPDAQSDGLLQTYEIMGMRLNARLVTLSSCESGLGKLYKGEGLLGLRRAFLLAGAESVVVSFWSVEDSTADFMEIFYTNIAQGQPIEEALRYSKLQYLKKTITAGAQEISLSHPFFWGPFGVSSTTIR